MTQSPNALKLVRRSPREVTRSGRDNSIYYVMEVGKLREIIVIKVKMMFSTGPKCHFFKYVD